LYSSPDIIRRTISRGMRQAQHVARMREKKNLFKIVVRKPADLRPLGSPRCMYEHKINLNKEGRKVWFGFIQLSKEYGGKISQTWLMNSSILKDVTPCNVADITHHGQ
jgi:hypothetical protein